MPTEHRYASWQELVASAELDVVSIATPTTLHAPIAVAALDAGLHVLSEKPIAENARPAREMVEAARRNDRVLDVSFNHRRRGDVQALKKIIDAGLLGDIYYAKAGWLRREGIPGLGSWFTRVATAGGGPLMDIGVHMLDMALHLLGEPAVRSATAATYAEFGPRGRGSSSRLTMRKTGVVEGAFDVEDLSTAFLRLDGGGHVAAGVELGAVDPAGPVLRHHLRVRRRRQHRVGRRPGTLPTLDIWTEVEGVPAELQPDVPPDGDHRECVLRLPRQGALRRATPATAARRRWPGPPWSTPATPRRSKGREVVLSR